MITPIRTKLPHNCPSWVSEGAWYFITLNCAQRNTNQLCVPETAKAILASIAFNHDRLAWFCHFALLMPDHLHAIITVPRDPGLTKTIANWKHFIAARNLLRRRSNNKEPRLPQKEIARA